MARLENLLGALALAASDRIVAAGSAQLPAASERAALATLLAHPDRPVLWLGDVLALTSSGATRLVDRLEAAGWVRRAPGDDARSRRLRLTASGRRQAERVLAARERAMSEVVATLSASDRAALERILPNLVAGLADDHPSALRVCRLCDRSACATRGAKCPLEAEHGASRV
jgi:DNA-binding MarR family transcriptional regulator